VQPRGRASRPEQAPRAARPGLHQTESAFPSRRRTWPTSEIRAPVRCNARRHESLAAGTVVFGEGRAQLGAGLDGGLLSSAPSEAMRGVGNAPIALLYVALGCAATICSAELGEVFQPQPFRLLGRGNAKNSSRRDLGTSRRGHALADGRDRDGFGDAAPKLDRACPSARTAYAPHQPPSARRRARARRLSRPCPARESRPMACTIEARAPRGPSTGMPAETLARMCYAKQHAPASFTASNARVLSAFAPRSRASVPRKL